MRSTEKRNSKAVLRLRRYLLFGAIYIAGGVLWIVTSYFQDRLDSPATILWVGGCLAFLLGMGASYRRLRRLEAGEITAESVEPDERKMQIADKAGFATFRWTLVLTLTYLGGSWSATEQFPTGLALLALASVALYFGHFFYYNRRL